MFLTHQSVQFRKALSVKVSHRFGAGSAVFDEDHLVSCAGLVPVMTLADQTGLGRAALGQKVRIAQPRVTSGAANPAPKLATVVAGMCAGADCIDDIDVVRSGGMKALFDGVYAPSTVGTNHIKSWKTHLAADRTSCTKATANQFRLFLHAGAYWLMSGLRASMPRRRCGALRSSTRCVYGSSVAARIVEMKTMIPVHLPASCPAQDILRLVLGRIPRLVT